MGERSPLEGGLVQGDGMLPIRVGGSEGAMRGGESVHGSNIGSLFRWDSE